MHEPLFTIILDAYYKPHFVKQAVDAIFKQTYTNLEIILVNNGATPDTLEYLYEAEAQDKRVKLIHFKENQFSLDDPLKMIDVCYNEALNIATGEYVFYQSYDDIMALDYVEKMVKLFQGNNECTTAAGLIITIDEECKKLSKKKDRHTNYRSRYMPGHLLALDHLRGNSALFGVPGTIFSVNRKVLVESGGFHRSMDLSAIYGIVPFGITGFDETAVFYWRRHEGQLNLYLSQIGCQTFETLSLIKDWDLQTRWENAFNKKIAKKVVVGLKNLDLKSAAVECVINLYKHRFVAGLRTVKKVWQYPVFWTIFPFELWAYKFMFGSPFRPYIKRKLQKLFTRFPSLSLLPMFGKINDRLKKRS